MELFDRYYDKDLYGDTYHTSDLHSMVLTGPVASVYDLLSGSATAPNELFFYNPWLTTTQLPEGSRSVLLSD